MTCYFGCRWQTPGSLRQVAVQGFHGQKVCRTALLASRFMSENDVLRYLAASSDNAHRAESILENQVGGDLSTEQWLARAAIATQIAHVDAMRALAAANHRLGDQLADIAALLPVKDATPADALAPFRGYRFG